jgi:large subunit ribosomal protein L9
MAGEKILVKLLKRLAGIGKEGEIVSVSHSQAKNYLIPKGFAIEVNKQVLVQEELDKKKKSLNRVTNIEERQKLAEILHMKEIAFTLRGHGEKIFGGIGEHEIIEAIKKEFKVELEKKNILLPEGHHIKKAGRTDFKIHVSEDTYIRMTVEVRV